MLGDKEMFDFVDYIKEVQKRRLHDAEKSKYKIGQYVRITEDKDKLLSYLMGLSDNVIQANMEAQLLRGKTMKVFMVEEFLNKDGTKSMYVNLEDRLGHVYLLPEDFVRDLGAR